MISKLLLLAILAAQATGINLTGTVKGNDVTFTFGTDVQGVHLDVSYTGTIESKDSLKGTVNLGGLGEGTFTAKRQ